MAHLCVGCSELHKESCKSFIDPIPLDYKSGNNNLEMGQGSSWPDYEHHDNYTLGCKIIG